MVAQSSWHMPQYTSMSKDWCNLDISAEKSHSAKREWNSKFEDCLCSTLCHHKNIQRVVSGICDIELNRTSHWMTDKLVPPVQGQARESDALFIQLYKSELVTFIYVLCIGSIMHIFESISLNYYPCIVFSAGCCAHWASLCDIWTSQVCWHHSQNSQMSTQWHSFLINFLSIALVIEL